MKRFLGQYIYHNNQFAKRGFLQINSDASFTTRIAKPSEEWGNTQFVNGILFPVYSSKVDKALLLELRAAIPNLITRINSNNNVLEAIDLVYMNKHSELPCHWFALKGIDLTDLRSIINISITVL